MKTISRIIVAILFASVLTGCFGKFALVRKVYSFNNEIGDKFARSIVFWIGGVFIPVYGLAAFADFVVFNTLEFWTGSNPIESGKIETQSSSTGGAEAIRTTNAAGEPMLEFRFKKADEQTIMHVERENQTQLRMTVFSTSHPTRTAVIDARSLSAERAAATL